MPVQSTALQKHDQMLEPQAMYAHEIYLPWEKRKFSGLAQTLKQTKKGKINRNKKNI